MTSDAELYRRLRHETASLLGFDVASLTPAQSIKTDLVSSLRLALDTLTAAQLAGEHVDTVKLLSAAEALERLLPSLVAVEQEAEDQSAQAALLDVIAGYDKAATDEKEDRIAILEAALADRDRQIAALSGTPAETPPAPAPSPTVKPERDAKVVPLRSPSAEPKPPTAHEAWAREYYGGRDTPLPPPGSRGSPRDW
jgi:hypothetical protein